MCKLFQYFSLECDKCGRPVRASQHDTQTNKSTNTNIGDLGWWADSELKLHFGNHVGGPRYRECDRWPPILLGMLPA